MYLIWVGCRWILFNMIRWKILKNDVYEKLWVPRWVSTKLKPNVQEIIEVVCFYLFFVVVVFITYDKQTVTNVEYKKIMRVMETRIYHIIKALSMFVFYMWWNATRKNNTKTKWNVKHESFMFFLHCKFFCMMNFEHNFFSRVLRQTFCNLLFYVIQL